MRTIRLTHREIEIIKNALQYAYDCKLDMISQNRKILGEQVVEMVLQEANSYLDTQEVFNDETLLRIECPVN